MEAEIFKAGVKPGSPTSNDEIKMLICYILSKTSRAMTFAELHETLSEHELVNYFELVAAADMLLQTGHIRAVNEENTAAPVYIATGIGIDAAGQFTSFLPASVREKALASAERLIKRKQRESEVTVNISKCADGFEVFLSLPDSGSNLISFSVFCPTKAESELVRKRFLNDPAYIYKGVLALLTGDESVLGEMFPDKEELF